MKKERKKDLQLTRLKFKLLSATSQFWKLIKKISKSSPLFLKLARAAYTK